MNANGVNVRDTSYCLNNAERITAKDVVTEIVRFILTISLIASLFVAVPIAGELLQGWTQPQGIVQPADPEPTREQLRVAMRYHGINYAQEDADGWFFVRDGKRCNIKFKEGE